MSKPEAKLDVLEQPLKKEIMKASGAKGKGGVKDGKK